MNWSGRLDSNQRPSAPKADALPGCATPRTQDTYGFSTTSAIRKRNIVETNALLLTKGWQKKWQNRSNRSRAVHLAPDKEKPAPEGTGDAQFDLWN